jgi:hypothetical protein
MVANISVRLWVAHYTVETSVKYKCMLFSHRANQQAYLVMNHLISIALIFSFQLAIVRRQMELAVQLLKQKTD